MKTLDDDDDDYDYDYDYDYDDFAAGVVGDVAANDEVHEGDWTDFL
jgi:hypothetical protein